MSQGSRNPGVDQTDVCTREVINCGKRYQLIFHQSGRAAVTYSEHGEW